MADLPTLSVVCVVKGAPERARAAVAEVRGLAQEVVLAVDDRAPVLGAAAYRRLADRVVPISSSWPDDELEAVLRTTRGAWTLRLDADELPSAALLRRLPALLEDDRVTGWAIRRRWLAPGGASWIDEVPWAPDFQLRLRRTAPDAREGPLSRVGWVDEPLYKLACADREREERLADALVLEITRPESESVGRRPLHRLLDPEAFATAPPAAVPEEDRRALARWLEPDRVRRAVTAVTRPRSRPTAQAPPAPPSATSLICLERDLRFLAGEARSVAFELANRSSATWSADGDVHIATRWRWADGRIDAGPRTPVAIVVPPGGTVTVPVAVAAPGFACTPDLLVELMAPAGGGELVLRAQVLEPFRLPDRRPALLPAPAPAGRRGLRRAPAIPRVLHQVWLGGGRPPEEHRAHMETWRTLNPRWEIRLWTDADAPIPPYAVRARNMAERVDVVRYEILRRHGGVYADTDVECLRPFDALVDGLRVFAGYEIPGRLCNAVMGGVPGHRSFERMVALAQRTIGTGVYPFATATAFITRILEPELEATLFGPELFYPYLWHEPRPVGTQFPNAYAVHHWAMSWVPPAQVT